MRYDDLLRETAPIVQEVDMPPAIKGLYCDNTIWINKGISTRLEKLCTLAEELGHYHTSTGVILDQKDVRNRKQELKARQWGYFKLVSLQDIVDAFNARIQGRYELAEYLNVTEEFLQSAIDRYKEKFGVYTIFDDRYLIFFEPLGVIEIFK